LTEVTHRKRELHRHREGKNGTMEIRRVEEKGRQKEKTRLR
jgi:hypothetical protein